MVFATSKYTQHTCVVCHSSAAMFFRVIWKRMKTSPEVHKLVTRVQTGTKIDPHLTHDVIYLAKKKQSSIEI
jgi:hypothetical protein